MCSLCDFSSDALAEGAREKALRTVTPKTIMNWIREGRMLPESVQYGREPPISDWTGVKSVTINDARVVCVGDDEIKTLPVWIHPLASLSATVDMGTTNFDVGLSCPVFEEDGPPRRTK